jgi:predicted ATP-binding protein involved in virulence
MQRHVLPDLIAAFPRARFVVATHNPLVVSSVKDSKIYVLKYNDSGKVESERLDFEKRPKTATEILDEVLGVSFTMPIWVEDKLRSIVESYIHKAMDKNDFEQMRNELTEAGLERLMPHAIKDVMGGKND